MRIGFYSGEVLKLTEDIGVLQPTFFPSVPRLFNKFYDKIQAKLKEATGAKGCFLKLGLNFVIEFIKKSWNRGKESWLKNTNIFRQF
jgi:long-chain acyl-CoA synthetase